ncbi:putative proenkephalin-A-like [Scophthalmus maximus]|uniref:Prepronociceptin b n=1 Tax=Scophthalmus maximus TaxID=52904 RepID=A0A2U9CYW2_SCOMX|nr:prepronociceptin b [Scophthalmus maximus]AWP19682.1 putative proenkephalin-A-like [Scophthalmus maximus]
MKIPVWCLLVLLACLFTPGRSDCQGQCAACGLLLQQQQQLQQAFNTMVCLLECEGRVSASLTWEVCERAVKLSHHPLFPEGALLKRAGEGLELTSLDLNSDSELLRPAAAGHFEEGDGDQMPLEQRSVRYDSSLLESSEEAGGLRGLNLNLVDEEMKPREERNVETDSQLEGDEDDSSEAVTLSKRFGGFQRGRHGYRKLIGSPMRPLQKRYGGFIGVRKSARKWNSQKRVNQLLRQYLGMRSSRSGRFNSVPVTRVWRQNKL